MKNYSVRRGVGDQDRNRIKFSGVILVELPRIISS